MWRLDSSSRRSFIRPRSCVASTWSVHNRKLKGWRPSLMASPWWRRTQLSSISSIFFSPSVLRTHKTNEFCIWFLTTFAKMIDSPSRHSYTASEIPLKMSSESKSHGPRVEIHDITPIRSRHDTNTSLHKRLTEEAATYFEGPRDIQRHSKLPLFMRLNGGILPKMILPLAFAGSWATAVMLIHTYVIDIGECSAMISRMC